MSRDDIVFFDEAELPRGYANPPDLEGDYAQRTDVTFLPPAIPSPEPFLVIDDSFEWDPRAEIAAQKAARLAARAGTTPLTVLGDPYDASGQPRSAPAQLSSELERRMQRLSIRTQRISMAAQDVHSETKLLMRMLAEWHTTAAGPSGAVMTPPGPPLVGLAYPSRDLSRRSMHSVAAEIMPRVPVSEEVAARFWRRVIRTPEHWIWRGGTNKNTGRGVTRIGNKLLYSHRVAYTLHTGRDITGELLPNTCQEPLCVQPDHHLLGGFSARTDRDMYAEDPEGINIPPGPDHRAASTNAARTMDLAVRRDGSPRRCRRGHALTVQPGGRVSCRACDRERKQRSVDKLNAEAPRILQRTTISRELLDELAKVKPPAYIGADMPVLDSLFDD